jgi:hypothetical protein
MSKIFKDNLQKLVEGGLVQHLFRMMYFDGMDGFQRYDLKGNFRSNVIENEQKAEPFQLSHLKAGFVIWLCAVLMRFSFSWRNYTLQIIKKIRKHLQSS